MGVVCRPRFGRPCYECGNTVPVQRINELAARFAERQEAFLPSDRLCVDCEKTRKRETTVTRRPR